MKVGSQGFRVAVVGAASLLGKELLAVLEERSFPISRLVTFGAEDEEVDLPIVDLREHSQSAVTDENITDAELDFAFLAARPAAASDLPAFLRTHKNGRATEAEPQTAVTEPLATAEKFEANRRPSARPLRDRLGGCEAGPHFRCNVIDLSETLADIPGRVLSIPFLERGEKPATEATSANGSGQGFFACPHSAAILISSVLLRFAARFPIRRAIAEVFDPASEIGPRAIEELQRQTVNLLSFQKIPQSVFGAQLAFNLLPRIGRSRHGNLAERENRIRTQLREYLGERVPLPAFRLLQAPVFYSMGFSLFVETVDPVSPEALGKALTGERIRLRRFSDPAPSPVEVAGSSDILVDAVIPDANHPAGVWIWAVADNLRLAAVNAVEIAERLQASG